MSLKNKLGVVSLTILLLVISFLVFVMDRFGLDYARFKRKLSDTMFTTWADINCESYDKIVLPLEDSRDLSWLLYRLTGYDLGRAIEKKQSSNLQHLTRLINRNSEAEIFVFISPTFIHSAQDEHSKLIELHNSGRVRLVVDYPYGGGMLTGLLQKCESELCQNFDDYIMLYFGPTLDQTETIPRNVTEKNILKHYGFWKLSAETTFGTHNEIIHITKSQLSENKTHYFPDGECVTSGVMLGHFKYSGIYSANSEYVLGEIPDNCLVFSDALNMAGTNLKISFLDSHVYKLFTNWASFQRTIKKRRREMKCSIIKV